MAAEVVDDQDQLSELSEDELIAHAHIVKGHDASAQVIRGVNLESARPQNRSSNPDVDVAKVDDPSMTLCWNLIFNGQTE